MPDTTFDTFADRLTAEGVSLVREGVRIVQVNLGYLCNQRCVHCHVAASPESEAVMDAETLERVIARILASRLMEVELTGGAPEMNPGFREAVTRLVAGGRRVTVRSNLTVWFEPGFETMPEFLAGSEVKIVASLPCYTKENVDAQRGHEVFAHSIESLKRLNALGYARPESGLELDLVYNPGGPFLPAPQAELEKAYRAILKKEHGVVFTRLVTIANVPIKRFASFLERKGGLEEYQRLLAERFNPTTIENLMCRYMLSVGWDGRLYDCDFNQALELEIPDLAGRRFWEIDNLEALATRIAVCEHCYTCTAGAGSGCHGAVVEA